DCLGEPLGLVVATSYSNWIYVAPILFLLRMDGRIAIDLAGARQEVTRLLQLRQPQHVVRSQRTHLQRRNRVPQVIDRTGRRREVQNVVQRPVNLQRVRNVMANEREAVVAAQVFQVGQAAGDQVID